MFKLESGPPHSDLSKNPKAVAMGPGPEHHS